MVFLNNPVKTIYPRLRHARSQQGTQTKASLLSMSTPLLGQSTSHGPMLVACSILSEVFVGLPRLAYR